MFLDGDYKSLIVLLWAILTKLRQLARAPKTKKADFFAISILSGIIGFFSVVYGAQQAVLIAKRVFVGFATWARDGVAGMGEVVFTIKGLCANKANKKLHRPSFPGFPNFYPTSFDPIAIPVQLPEDIFSPKITPSNSHNDLVSILWDASYAIATPTPTWPGSPIITDMSETPEMASTPSTMSRSSSTCFDIPFPVTPRLKTIDLPLVDMYDVDEEAEEEQAEEQMKGIVWAK